MLRTVCTAAAVALMFLVLTASILFLRQGDRRVVAELESHEIDLGAVPANSMIRRSIPLTNRSSAMVSIQKVETSCSCSVPESVPHTIEPGGTQELPVSVDVGPMEGPALWIFTIRYGEGRVAECRVRANVYRLFPSVVVFPEYRRGARGETAFSIYSLDDRPMSIVSMTSDAEYFDLSWSRGINPREVRVTVRQTVSIPHGAFQKQLVITTNEAENRVKLIDVRGCVVRRLVSDSERVGFGLVPRNGVARQWIRLSAPYGGAIRFQSCEADPPGAVVVPHTELIAQENGDLRIPLELTLPESLDVLNGRLLLRARVGSTDEVVRIEFSAAVR